MCGYRFLNFEPIIVRSFPAGKYEIISGHRRVEACKALGITSIPVTIKELTKDEAIVQMVDSNIHREHILPSEKAFAYKMKSEALKHQGKTYGQVVHKSRDNISDTESGRNVQRYIRLTYLIPELLIPMAYWRSKGLNRGGKKTQTNPYKWCKTTIQKILSQQEYCGDIINFKTYSKSFKNKRRIENSKENWAVFKDVNEPIIDRETFETVQKFISKTKRRAPKKENGERSIFNGLIYCGDCHSKMRYHTSTSNKEIHYFTCSDNKVDYRGKCPGRHYVRADALEEVVKLELRRLVEMLEIDESYFARLLLRKNDEEREKDKKFLETELQKAIARSNTVSQLYEKLYEDNVIGKVSDEWFVELSHKYEKERMDLKAKIADTRHQIEELKNTNSEYGKFISAIRRFMQMDNLTSPLLRELIDHIDIFETEGTGKSRTQRIVIYYRFIGYIELPNTTKQTHIADTRKGVAVEYITEQFTA